MVDRPTAATGSSRPLPRPPSESLATTRPSARGGNAAPRTTDTLPPRADGAPDEEFTERELQVLAMLSSPLSTREIGEELFVSRNTIKTHLRRVYRKLDASSREEAVLIARDRGLLEASDVWQPSSG